MEIKGTGYGGARYGDKRTCQRGRGALRSDGADSAEPARIADDDGMGDEAAQDDER